MAEQTEQTQGQVQAIGDFEIYRDQLLGKGAWGEVYRGRQISLDREVAVKILKKDLSQDEEFVRRFMREAKCIAKLINENIIQVYGAGQYEGAYYFAMEFVRGMPLQKFLDHGRKFATDEIIYVAMAVSRALKVAWESPEQVVHRDIKPSNIMVSFTSSLISSHRKSETDESIAFVDIDIKESNIKVMDFGLAKVASTSGKDMTLVGTIIGTPKYISPEQGLGNPADIRSDIYSLGIVMYELATGRIPFTSDSAVSLVRHHIYDTALPPTQFNPDIPADLESVIMKCIQKDPNHRYGNPGELLEDLDALRRATKPLYAMQTMANIDATMMARPHVSKSKNLLFIISAAAVIIIAAVIGLIYFPRSKPEPTNDNRPSLPPIVLPSDNVSNPAVSPPITDTTTTGKPEPSDKLPMVEQTITPTEDPTKKLSQLFAAITQYIEYGSPSSLEEAGRLLVEARKIDENNEEVKKLDAMWKQKNEEVLKAADRKKKEEKYEASMRMGKEAVSKKDWKPALKSFYDAQAINNTAAVADEIQNIKSNVDLIEQYENLLNNAHKLEDENDYEKAIEAYKQLLELFSKIKDLYQREPVSPREDIKKCEDKIKDSGYQKLITDGENLLKEKKYISAEKIFKQAREMKPNDQISYLKLEEIKKQFPPDMVFVEEGEFTMGEKGRNEKVIPVASFFMDTYEVTNEDYKKFYDYILSKGDHSKCHKSEKPNKKHLPDYWKDGNYHPSEAKLPVVGIDWYDAYGYALWSGKRLPGSVEWEKASRGTDAARIYPGGWKDKAEVKANVKGVGTGTLTAVGFYPQDISPYGCYDMTGNALEWVSDLEKGKAIIRGGYWGASPTPVYKTSDELQHSRFPYLGFRCAKSIK